MESKIYSIHAREIIDSRAYPTVETLVILQSGYRGVSSVPSGASVGKHEAVELRDGDKKRFDGQGVLKAVENVNTVIAPALVGKDPTKQAEIDASLIALDGTPAKAKLGANSILSVSQAIARAAAAQAQMPLYKYINVLAGGGTEMPMTRIPTPTFNVINGGAHGAGNLDFQEFHITPASNRAYHEAYRMGVELYHGVKKILKYRNAISSVGDEGGFAPNLFTNLDALEVLMEAVREGSYRFGVDVFFGLDLAANHFKTSRGYEIKDRAIPFSRDEFITYLKDMHKQYHVLLLEDPLDEDDWEGWTKITKEMGEEILIVGDDLLVTNPERFKKAIEQKACSAILMKPNQIGTLTEFLQVAVMAKQHDIKIIVSHRSGETNDTFISDLAVGIQSEYVKFGAPARGERVGKYNRLLAIENELFPDRVL